MIHALVRDLVNFAIHEDLMEASDAFWAVNQLLAVLRLDAMPESGTLFPSSKADEGAEKRMAGASPDSLLSAMLDWAVGQGLLEDTPTQRDAFDTALMGCLTPRPSAVIQRFQALYAESPRAATDDFYRMGIASNYIRKTRMERDQVWRAMTQDYGELDITINLSKPEKDPRDIAKARDIKASGYPRCLLCVENEGFSGTGTLPARQNLRLVPLELNGKPWFLQYSPYGYYNEHCIILNREHTPMQINRAAFSNFAAFLRLLPHYFIGSNADLPIVGGSILSHDHYQGGRYEFPMDRAEVEKWYPSACLCRSDVELGRVRWPMSVLRLRSTQPEALVDFAEHVLHVWRGYSDASVEILSMSLEEKADAGQERQMVPHNTITPIARRRGDWYEFDLVLRNNRVSDEHPLGIFHPHAELHPIKKENIGLIEVLGLAILPPRLLQSIEGLTQAWLAGRPSVAYDESGGVDDTFLAQHDPWYRTLRVRHAERLSASNAQPDRVRAMLRQEIGAVFEQVLADSGVFKRTPEGMAAFDRFVAAL